MTAGDLSLLIGGPDSGKSTFLVQLYGRLSVGQGHASLADTPASLRPVREGLARLSQGLAVSHTSAGTETVQELAVRRHDGELLRLSIPDYPGEAVDELVDGRRISSHWRTLIAESTSWRLFVRVARMDGLPGLPERQDRSPILTERTRELPMDIRLVELLQILRHERQRVAAADAMLPDLTVVLSCWDEIPDLAECVTPRTILRQQIPLLDSYVISNWGDACSRVVGLSAQGRPLDTADPDPEFIDRGPEEMGYMIREDGSRTGDISELLAR